MKKILYAFFILLSIQKIYAQSSIILPNGTVIPSFTQATRPANPTRGQLIYQTDGTAGLYIWSGTAWTAVSTGSGGGSGTVTNVTANSPLSVTNGSTTPAITIQQANGTTNGFLSSADWTTFNNKQNSLSDANATTSGILTSTDWNTFNNKQSPLSNANATTSGILTSADWNIFNNKQNPLSNANATTSGILTSADWNTFNNKQNALQNADATTSGILTSTDWNTFNNKQSSLSNANATTSGILTSADWNIFNNKQNTLQNANATTSGILTSADWNTFNNKQSPLSNANATTSGILTSTDWNTFNNKQNALQNADATTSGILTSADWNTFNNKQSSLSNANATTSGILTSTDWNTFNNKFSLPTLTSGSLLFSNGSTINQNNSKLYWDNINFRLGVGTSNLTFPLHVSSQGPPTDNGGGNTWISASIGASSGSRLVLGTKDGNPTIGATNEIHIQWDTLEVNPGGMIRFPFYANTSSKLLSTNSTGIVKGLSVTNGLKIQNDSLQLGGTLSNKTNINMNNKDISFMSGGIPAVTTNIFTTGTYGGGYAIFGQSFRAETNGVLNAIRIRAYSYPPNPINVTYEIFDSPNYSGQILYTGNLTLSPFGGNFEDTPIYELPININVVAGRVYTIRLNPNGNPFIILITDSDVYPHGQLFMNGVPYPYDLRIQVVETEPTYNLLKLDAVNKNVALEGTVGLKINSIGGTGTRNVVVTPDGTLQAGSSNIGTVSQITTTAPLSVINASTTPQIAISQANTSTNGFLSSTDWNTFNNKQNVLGNASASASGILTTADWNTFNNKVAPSLTINTALPLIGGGNLGADRTISITQANSTTNGYLSSTDWNTFNNKYNLPNLTNGSILFSNGSNISQSNSNLFWDNTNKALGIGTTSPTAGLHIHGYNWDNGFRISSGTTVGPAVFLDGDTDFALISTGTSAGSGANKFGVYDATANQYRMVIDNSGAMGVGIINPSTKMDISGLGGLKVSSNYNGSGFTDWVSGNFGGQTGDRLVVGVFNQTPTIGGHNSDLNAWRNLALNPDGGNVGVGTTSPTAKLDIVGTVRMRTGATENAVLVSDANGNASWNSKTPLRTGSVAVTVPPTVSLGGTTTYGTAEVEWVHNLGYQPIIMISNEQTNNYSLMEYVKTSYYHVDNNTLRIKCVNMAGGMAEGTFRILIVN